jgi:3-deoxy-manno-octulosonate cytidylyltransferase (CMP-KDO synthetase)
MIEHVYRRAASARGVGQVIVATDDERIASAVTAFGGTVRMTRADHRTGTDRLAEVAADLTCDLIVNVQGDLPLLDPAMIEDAVAPLISDPTLQIGTLCTPIVDDADYRNPNVVKVVRNRRGDALYFSRAPIPHVRNPDVTSRAAFKHIGLYAYRRAFVRTFAGLPPSLLELAESLEQLRALEHGYRIHVVLTNVDSIEVDTPEDLERVRQLMAVGAPD